MIYRQVPARLKCISKRKRRQPTSYVIKQYIQFLNSEKQIIFLSRCNCLIIRGYVLACSKEKKKGSLVGHTVDIIHFFHKSDKEKVLD